VTQERASNDLGVYRDGLKAEQQKRLKAAAQQGITEGGQGLPHSDQEHPPAYQAGLHALCGQDLVEMQSRFGETVQTKYAEIVAAERKLARSSAVWKNETDGLLQNLKDEISVKENAAEQAYRGKETLLVDILHNQIVKPYNQVLTKLNEVRAKLGREVLDTWLDHSVLYTTLLALIGLSEYPLNLIVFAALRLPVWDTILLSGTLVIAIPLAAHFTGVSWKRRAEKGSHNIWIAILCVAAVVALSWYIGEQRYLYVAEAETSISDEAARLSRWILFGLSLLLYGLATLLSYGFHDRDAALQSITHEHKKAKKKYDKEHPPREAELNELTAAHSANLAAISSASLARQEEIRERRNKLESTVTKLRGSYDARLLDLKATEKFIANLYVELVKHYQSQNVIARPNHAEPVSFNVPLRGFDGYFAALPELDPNRREF
jgi:hypothetical protein